MAKLEPPFGHQLGHVGGKFRQQRARDMDAAGIGEGLERAAHREAAVDGEFRHVAAAHLDHARCQRARGAAPVDAAAFDGAGPCRRGRRRGSPRRGISRRSGRILRGWSRGRARRSGPATAAAPGMHDATSAGSLRSGQTWSAGSGIVVFSLSATISGEVLLEEGDRALPRQLGRRLVVARRRVVVEAVLRAGIDVHLVAARRPPSAPPRRPATSR